MYAGHLRNCQEHSQEATEQLQAGQRRVVIGNSTAAGGLRRDDRNDHEFDQGSNYKNVMT